MSTKKAKTAPAEKDKKPKLVRDSFTIPKNEYLALDSLKERALQLGVAVKKSELLRAGLMVLCTLNDEAYKAALAGVPTLKTGRPSSGESKAATTAQAPSAKAVTAAAKKVTRTPAAAKKAPAPVAKKSPVKPPVRKTPLKRTES